MQKCTRFVSALLLLALLLGLIPALNVSARAGFATQEHYTTAKDDVYEYSYTPSESGLYEISTQGSDTVHSYSIEITDSKGAEALGTCMDFWPSSTSVSIYYLEKGKTYTYRHTPYSAGSFMLTIARYNHKQLVLNNSISGYYNDDYSHDVLAFTPTATGWYTITSDGGAGLACIEQIWRQNSSGDYEINYAYEYLPPENLGLHFYFEAGKTAYIFVTGYDSSFTIKVKKSAKFAAITEEKSAKLVLGNTISWGIDGGSSAYNYVTFTPVKSGVYSFDFSSNNSCFIEKRVYDSFGKYVKYDDNDGGYLLQNGETYYVGASYFTWEDYNNTFTTTVSVKCLSEKAVECTEHKYTSATGNTCTVCGYEYEPQLFEYNYTMYAVNDIVPVRDNYYSRSSKVVARLSKGDSVKVTHWLKNALGNNWYMTEDGYYIYVENLSKTSPYAHTLTFDANGGTGGPTSVTTVAAKCRISSTNVPTRDRYDFLGWSTDKNATTPEYTAGQSIKLDKDITLYAVWAKKISSLENLPSEIIAALNSTEGIKQEPNSDKCTKCATATLLKRRQVATGKAGTFKLEDIEEGAGYSAIAPGLNRYESNGNTYTCTAVQPYKITGDPMKYIIDLLDEHPEGIVIYCNYYNFSKKRDSQHAVVLSDYELDDAGNYQLYAYDPGMSNTGRMKFEETSLYKGCNSTEHPEYMAYDYESYENVFANFISGSCGCIWYVKTEE